MFTEIFSPGADILYGRGASLSGNPTLLWYRYSPNTDTWSANGAGTPVGYGWNTDIHVTAAPDSCRFA